MTQAKSDNDLLQTLAELSLDTVAGAFAYSAGQDLNKPNLVGRRRTELIVTDAAGTERLLYMKRYERERLKDRFRRMMSGGSSSPAADEFRNIESVRNIGLATMSPIVLGQDKPKFWPARSYIIVSAVAGDALERNFGKFARLHPERRDRQAFTEKLAQLVRTLHGAGYVHRDLYSCHIFLDLADDNLQLYLIDLARMFKPCRWRFFRWRVKDLAQLKYSMPDWWVAEYWDSFTAEYLAGEGANVRDKYNRAVARKVRSIRRRQERKRNEQ